MILFFICNNSSQKPIHLYRGLQMALQCYFLVYSYLYSYIQTYTNPIVYNSCYWTD